MLNPATPLTTLEEVLPDLDQVLIMSVNPGFGGQSFIEGSVEKVRRLKRMLDERGLATAIEIDGGIGPDNAAPGPWPRAPRCWWRGSSVYNAPEGAAQGGPAAAGQHRRANRSDGRGPSLRSSHQGERESERARFLVSGRLDVQIDQVRRRFRLGEHPPALDPGSGTLQLVRGDRRRVHHHDAGSRGVRRALIAAISGSSL